MVRRIAAFRDFFGVSVTMIEFVAGIRFLFGLFDSDETVREVWESFVGTMGQADMVSRAVSSSGSSGMDGPPVLLLALGFILLGLFLFSVGPAATREIERKAGRRYS